jgi:hypothetical protein
LHCQRFANISDDHTRGIKIRLEVGQIGQAAVVESVHWSAAGIWLASVYSKYRYEKEYYEPCDTYMGSIAVAYIPDEPK